MKNQKEKIGKEKKIEREIKRSELLIDKSALDKHREKEKLRMRRYRDNKEQKHDCFESDECNTSKQQEGTEENIPVKNKIRTI